MIIFHDLKLLNLKIFTIYKLWNHPKDLFHYIILISHKINLYNLFDLAIKSHPKSNIN